jgi:hypothetical protein
LHALLDLRVFHASTIPMDALSRSLGHGRLHAIERRLRCGARGREQRDRRQNHFSESETGNH